MRQFSNAEELQNHYRAVKTRLGMSRRPPVVTIAAIQNKSRELVLQAKRDAEELAKAIEKARLDAMTQEPSRMKRIMRVTCNYFGISYSDMISQSRSSPNVYCRQIAMYLCRERLASQGSEIGSYPQIGKAFNGRDHSTVLHAHLKIEKQVEWDATLRRHLNEIHKELNKIEGASKNDR